MGLLHFGATISARTIRRRVDLPWKKSAMDDSAPWEIRRDFFIFFTPSPSDFEKLLWLFGANRILILGRPNARCTYGLLFIDPLRQWRLVWWSNIPQVRPFTGLKRKKSCRQLALWSSCLVFTFSCEVILFLLFSAVPTLQYTPLSKDHFECLFHIGTCLWSQYTRIWMIFFFLSFVFREL